MNSLPSEILQNILTYLSSQRDISNYLRVCKRWQSVLNAPIIYSTIELTSSSQVTKFFHFAKTKTIDGLPVGHFVYCLKLHTSNLPKEIINIIPNILPNIKQVIDLTKDKALTQNKIRRIQLQPKFNAAALTHFYYWNTIRDTNWMHRININKVIFLQFGVHEKLLSLTTNHHPPHQRFGLCQDTNIKRSVLREHDMRDYGLIAEEDGFLHNYSKVLELPYLSNLTTLGIIFVEFGQWNTINYDLDERTLESIHISCPLLESLQLLNFQMNLSDTFELSLSSSSDTQFMPSSLKTLEIDGNIYDARCYYYLSIKYPQLEQLKLTLDWPDRLSLPHVNGMYEPFYISLHNMMTSYQHLKQLVFFPKAKVGYIDPIYNEPRLFDCNSFVPSLNTLLTSHSWTHPHIISWLLLSPINYWENITHLDYPLDMMMEIDLHKIKKITEHNFYSDSNNSDNNDSDTNDLDHDHKVDNDKGIGHSLFYFNLHNHLNGLASLSLTVDTNMTHLLLYYLLQDGNISIASSTLKDLKINHKTGNISFVNDLENNEMVSEDDFYIYDWLAVFPRLKIFTLNSGVLIKDGTRSNEKKNDKFNLDTQKQKQKQENNDHPITRSYPLEELIIDGGALYFKNGFTTFCQSCPHLKRIDLKNIYYALPHWKDQDLLQLTYTNQTKEQKEKELAMDMTFDLSHLRLDYLSLDRIRYLPWFIIDYANQPIITTLILNEKAYSNNNDNYKDVILYSDHHNTVTLFSPEYPMKIVDFPSIIDIACFQKKLLFVDSQPYNWFNLRVLCQSVDILIFKV
ncbi:unnamed protein product [Cunninghamella echinulata]